MTAPHVEHQDVDAIPRPWTDFQPPVWRFEDLPERIDEQHQDAAGDQQPARKVKPWKLALLLLALPLFPIVVPLVVLFFTLSRLKPAAEWVARLLDDPGPHNVWGKPDPEQVHKMLAAHGCYYLHGPLGSGKSMGLVVLCLLMAWKQAEQHDGEQFVFLNLTVDAYWCRLFLLRQGCPSEIVRRIRIEQFSVMDASTRTHEHVWRRRWSVIGADEIPYYMEEDKKTIRTMLLKAFRMARRRQQIVIGVGQELIHSRYRALFRLRGVCSMTLGRMKIVWRGAQDPVDAKKPTKPQGVTAYGLDIRRIAKCYDTWEDLEDLDDDSPPVAAGTRAAGRAA